MIELNFNLKQDTSFGFVDYNRQHNNTQSEMFDELTLCRWLLKDEDFRLELNPKDVRGWRQQFQVPSSKFVPVSARTFLQRQRRPKRRRHIILLWINNASKQSELITIIVYGDLGNFGLSIRKCWLECSVTFMSVYLAIATMWFLTWMANSRVGVSTSPLSLGSLLGNLNSGKGWLSPTSKSNSTFLTTLTQPG